MQFTLALLSGLGLATGAMAQAKEPRALDFTTWPCNDCARNGPHGCSAQQINHHDRFNDTCYQLEANQQSLIVDHITTAIPNCELHLYGSTDCSGNGPVFGYENNARNCKPTPASERTSYKIICQGN